MEDDDEEEVDNKNGNKEKRRERIQMKMTSWDDAPLVHPKSLLDDDDDPPNVKKTIGDDACVPYHHCPHMS